jgi:hypothetical protein
MTDAKNTPFRRVSLQFYKTLRQQPNILGFSHAKYTALARTRECISSGSLDAVEPVTGRGMPYGVVAVRVFQKEPKRKVN